MVTLEEKDQKKVGLIGTLVFHAILAGLFLFMAFSRLDPPLSEGGSGIELNYGTDPAGFGDTQSLAAANDSENQEDSKPAAQSEEKAPATEDPQEEVKEVTEEKIITGSEESPVSVREIEKPTPKKEEKKEEVKPVEKPKSLYPGKSTAQNGSNGNTGSSNNATGNNNGDKPGSTGDQGNPEGSLNADALYGKPGQGGGGQGGSGGGAKLNMMGWAFDTPPRPEDNSSESGRIVFNIKVNKDGEITYCTVQESNVSPAVTKLYKDAVTKASLSPTGGGTAAAGASGTVTFILKAR